MPGKQLAQGCYEWSVWNICYEMKIMKPMGLMHVNDVRPLN